jgi:hypothetical protein
VAMFARLFEKQEIENMSGSQTDELAPQLFECFIDRAEANLPEFFPKEAKGAVVAGPDLIRELEDYSDSHESWSWDASVDNAHFRCGYVDRDDPNVDGELDIIQQAEFWYIYRVFDPCRTQALVVAFENVPVCTRTFRDAIRLAEHCHPETRAPMAGFWLGVRRGKPARFVSECQTNWDSS